MRILFITQKVDFGDDLLGIYHEWIAGLARKVESVEVICLYEGKRGLPPNVHTFSLGKERSAGSPFRRVLYILRFYRYLWLLRKRYDAVFVHMNKEYVLLGAPVWKLGRIPVFFWYNHPKGDWMACSAFVLADKVLHTSPFAASAKLLKAVRMPVGVAVPDNPAPSRGAHPFSVVMVGRISPVKGIDLLIEALPAVRTAGVPVRVSIYGTAVDRKEDRDFEESLRKRINYLGLQGVVSFAGSVPNRGISEIFRGADLSVNLTTTGSMDKTIFESMAAGCPVITTNRALAGLMPPAWEDRLLAKERDADDVAQKIVQFYRTSEDDRKALGIQLRDAVAREHSIGALIDRLMQLFSSLRRG